MAAETEASKVDQLIAERQANPEMTMKELAESCGLSLMRAKRLLAKARNGKAASESVKAQASLGMAASKDGKASATLGAQFHVAVCDLLSQEDFQQAVHGVFEGIVMSKSFIDDFECRRPLRIPPCAEPPANLYPLGGCKCMATFIGMLGSAYTEEAKFEQRKFSSRGLQGGFCDPREPNAKENVLKKEVEVAKELLRQGDAGVTLTVSLADIYAQENPREASHPSRKSTFAHVFNIVMCNSTEPGKPESRIYSAHIDLDLKAWVKDKGKSVMVDVDHFVDRINQVEGAQMWTREIDETWFSLFGVKRPLLCEKQWQIKTHIRVLRSVFDVESLKASVALFKSSNWTFEDLEYTGAAPSIDTDRFLRSFNNSMGSFPEALGQHRVLHSAEKINGVLEQFRQIRAANYRAANK